VARDENSPDMSNTSLEDVVSSEELLKRAWSTMGRTRQGERVDRSETTSSGAMTSSANAASTASSEARTMAAEDIARLLKAETEQRQPTAPQPAPRRASRPAAAPARPRRTTHTELPSLTPAPSQQPPPPRPTQARRPQPDTQPRPAPAPAQVPEGQPRPSRRRNLGWLIFAGIWAVSYAVGALSDGNSSTPDNTAAVTEATVDASGLTSTTLGLGVGDVTMVNIRDVEPGSCIAFLEAGETVDAVPTIPCAEPHQYELFGTPVLADAPGQYPGLGTVRDAAFELCSVEFAEYVGEAYESSRWFIDVLTPTEAGWNATDDREVSCLLYLWDDDVADLVNVSGSAAGTGGADG